MFYIINLVIPTVIITIISYLGLFSLTSSSGERGEKVSLGMGTILALAVVMLMVQDTMPNTSLSNPMICKQFSLFGLCPTRVFRQTEALDKLLTEDMKCRHLNYIVGNSRKTEIPASEERRRRDNYNQPGSRKRSIRFL